MAKSNVSLSAQQQLPYPWDVLVPWLPGCFPLLVAPFATLPASPQPLYIGASRPSPPSSFPIALPLLVVSLSLRTLTQLDLQPRRLCQILGLCIWPSTQHLCVMPNASNSQSAPSPALPRADLTSADGNSVLLGEWAPNPEAIHKFPLFGRLCCSGNPMGAAFRIYPEKNHFRQFYHCNLKPRPWSLNLQFPTSPLNFCSPFSTQWAKRYF